MSSQLHGARWAPRNSFPTVYPCETVEAALQEYLARARRMKLPDHKSLPMVMAWVKVKAANLLDTTDAEIATVINPLLATDKVHWRAIQDRREAVSPAMPGSKNIIIFPQKLTASESPSAPVSKVRQIDG